MVFDERLSDELCNNDHQKGEKREEHVNRKGMRLKGALSTMGKCLLFQHIQMTLSEMGKCVECKYLFTAQPDVAFR